MQDIVLTYSYLFFSFCDTYFLLLGKGVGRLSGIPAAPRPL